MESIETVLLFGNRAPLQLINEKLIVGERLGQVSDETPAVPLQQDVAALQKRLRMPAEGGQQVLDLDLRKPADVHAGYGYEWAFRQFEISETCCSTGRKPAACGLGDDPRSSRCGPSG